ncbi:MAG: hypothetical protein AAGF32_03095 [Pseudomonadota bacterium]
MTTTSFARNLLTILAMCIALFPGRLSAQDQGPTVEEYMAYVGASATLVPAGKLKIDGQRVSCGRRPTVLDPTLDDYGAAFPRFLILNPKRFGGLPTAVKRYIYAHECAHQFRGPDEETADCFAVQRGRRYGWLKPSGLNQICSFISKAESSWMHFAGPKRCKIMRRCYADKTRIW